MNDKSRFDELLIKATAPQGGTPWSSQSVVREEKSPTQESPDERQYREDVEAGVDMSTPAQESQIIALWDKVAPLVEKMKAKYPPECNIEGLEPALTHDICEIVAEAKREDRERILEEMKKQYAPPLYTNDGRRGYDSCLSDLTNIINNHE